MKNIRKTLFLIFLSLVCSCTNEFDEISNVTSEDPMMVTAILPDWDLEDVETRTSITTGAYPTAPSPVWVSGDSIGIYPNAGGDQLSFRINEGGSKTCSFDGGGWAMTSASYTAYSPFKRSYYYEQKDALPISMLGQTQNGNDNADHLGAYDIQIATGEKPETGSLIFSFSRKVALVRLEITAPKAASWTSISLESDALFTTDAIMNLDLETPAVTPVTTSNSVTLNLKNVSTTRDNLSIIAYMMLLPVDLTGKRLSVKLTDNEGNIYSKEASVTNNKTNFAANAARWVTADFEEIIPNNEIWYTSSDGNIVVPYAIDEFGASIVSNTYENGRGVITFDRDVTLIGEDALFNSMNLTSIIIPNGVTTIGKWAFYNCRNLVNVIIGNQVSTIEESAFRDCVSLSHIKMGENIKTIGDMAFWSCFSLANLILPDNVISVGNRAFLGCSELTNLVLGNNLTTIGTEAFEGCINLISVDIPNSVANMGTAPFAGCANLKKFSGKFASNDGRCLIINGILNSFAPSEITSYTIPENVTYIGHYAFSQCRDITSVTIPDNVSGLGAGTFANCNNLTNVTISNSITEIEYHSFFNCSSLKNVTIPEDVKELNHAFEGCSSLETIIIPKNITYIGSATFKNCGSLAKVVCLAIKPPGILDDTFNGCSSDLKIYVPSESFDAYKAANYWQDLNIVSNN